MTQSQIVHELALLYVSKCEFDTPEELAKAYLEAKKAINPHFLTEPAKYNATIKGGIQPVYSSAINFIVSAIALINPGQQPSFTSGTDLTLMFKEVYNHILSFIKKEAQLQPLLRQAQTRYVQV